MPNSKASKLVIIGFCGVAVATTVGLLAYSFWNDARVKNLSQRLRAGESQNYDVQKQLDFLIGGCNKSGNRAPSFPPFIAELVHGNCRSLAGIKVPPTYFNEPNFKNLDLRSADLSQSHLVAGQFNLADLTEANLKSADLSGADLSFVLLQKAELQRANLSATRIHNSNLQGSNLQGANLDGANLIASNLSKADFSDADLRGAVLSGAVTSKGNFRNANFQSAILADMDLRQALNLTTQQFQGQQAPLLCKTRLPESIQVDSNRDCAEVPSVLAERFPWHFRTAEMAARALRDDDIEPYYGGTYPRGSANEP